MVIPPGLNASKSPSPSSLMTTPNPFGALATAVSSMRIRNSLADALVGSSVATIRNADKETIVRRKRMSDSLPAAFAGVAVTM